MMMMQNNHIGHSLVVDDMCNAQEYKTFDSTFLICDEGIILTSNGVHGYCHKQPD
jgi:hypothetical protein